MAWQPDLLATMDALSSPEDSDAVKIFGELDFTVEAIEACARRIAPYTIETPVHRWTGQVARQLFGPDADIWVKLELLQVTGSFKARGALNVALQLSASARHRGFTTFSSGNHAAAVAYAAHMLGTTATVVMLESANPARIDNCRRWGAKIVMASDAKAAMEIVRVIVAAEGRTFIHPYEGPHTSAGSATISRELVHQVPDLDAVIVAVGGGGLCSGVGAGMKLLRPQCRVWAIEPQGADTMNRSFRSGKPESLEAVATIADSLAPPQTLPYSLALCRHSVDALALISDDEMRVGMKHLFSDLKLAVEPGGAAALAAALGPFRNKLAGRRVVIVVCGSNIDSATLHRHLEQVNS